MLMHAGRRVRIDQLHPAVTIGRSTDCDIVVNHMFASRRHATIKLRRTRFYLIDHSTSGTFVRTCGEAVHVLRGERTESGDFPLYRSSARLRTISRPSRPRSRACSGDSLPSAVPAIISNMSAAPSRMRGVMPVSSKVFAISFISGTQR